jgi:hypothetical protein
MKKLLFCLMLMFLPVLANAQAIMADGTFYVENDPVYYSSMRCRWTAPYCAPHKIFYNRTRTKIIGEYQPAYPAIYPWANMSVWRIGNAVQGLTTADWQDIEDAKVKSGGYWRWGICWNGSHPATICLN